MKLNEDIGFAYLCERTSPEENIVKDFDVHDKNGIFYVEYDTCLHSFEVMNRNSRQYIASNIEECLNTERILTYLKNGGWFGEMNHPIPEYKDSPLSPQRIQDIKMDNTSHKMLNPHISGNLLLSRIQSDAGTEAGMNMARKMVQGFKPGFSCRAIASMGLFNNKPTVNVKKIITYDWVLYQSHREAEQVSDTSFIKKVPEKVISIGESVKDRIMDCGRDVMIPLKEIMESVGRRDPNTQIIMEAFDLDLNDMVGFSKNNEHVILRDNDNTIYCNIRPDVKKEVNDFFASF